MPDSGVLVVDDRPVALRACGTVFEDAHADVDRAGDVEEGYRCVVANRPAVVVADLTSRDRSLSGLSLIARILVFSMHDEMVSIDHRLAVARPETIRDRSRQDIRQDIREDICHHTRSLS